MIAGRDPTERVGDVNATADRRIGEVNATADQQIGKVNATVDKRVGDVNATADSTEPASCCLMPHLFHSMWNVVIMI